MPPYAYFLSGEFDEECIVTGCKNWGKLKAASKRSEEGKSRYK